MDVEEETVNLIISLSLIKCSCCELDAELRIWMLDINEELAINRWALLVSPFFRVNYACKAE